MAGDTIGKLSLKIDGDASGLKRATDQAKADVNGLTSQGAKSAAIGMGKGGGMGHLDLQSMMSGEGLLHMAGKFAGVGVAIGVVALGAERLFHSLYESGNEVKNLQLAAEKAGVSFDWMQRAEHYAHKVGVEIESVILGFGRLRKNLSTAVFGEMDPKKAMAELGLNESSLLLSREKLYQTVATRIIGIGDAFKRTAVEMALFGRAGQELELFLKKLSKGEEEPLISKSAAASLRQFKDEFMELGEKYHAWWVNVKGGFLEMLGFGKTHAELAKEAATHRAREAKEARDTARAIREAAFEKDAMGKNAIAESSLASLGKLEESLRDAIAKAGGMTEEELQRLKILGEGLRGGIYVDTSELDTLIKSAAAAKEKMEAQHEAAAATKAAATAEETFVKATAKAHEWARRHLITREEEYRLIQKAGETLQDSWKSKETSLPGLSMRDSQEAYRFSMEDRQRAVSDAANQLRMTELQLQAARDANKALEAIQKNTERPSSYVVTM
jgi:hypothetical protein